MSEIRLGAVRVLILTAGMIASCLAVAFISLHALYPSTGQAATFLGYVVVFNLLPGLVITRLFLPGVKEVGVYLIFSLAIGMVANVLAVTALWSVGLLSLLFMLPMLAIGLAIIRLRRLDTAERLHWNIGWRIFFGVLAGACLLSLTALLGVGFIYSGNYVESFSSHAAFEGVIIRGLESGWPPPNLLFPNAPWSYNYLAHLWVLGVKLTTGLPIDVLVTNYGPAILGGTSAALLLAFGRYVLGLAWWVAALPMVCVYWAIGIAPISGAIFASFMPYGANLILSPFLAILLFLLIFAFISERGDTTRSYLVFRIATLVVLSFLATGARGVCTPIVVCALSFRLAWDWWSERLYRQNAVDLIAVIIGFAAGLIFFFTIGTEFSGTGALKITGEPFRFLAREGQTLLTLPRTLMGWGVAALPAGIIAFAVIALFQAAFLTPALPRAYVAIRRKARTIDVLLIGSGIAGIAGFFLTEAPGYSHLSFLYFSNISFALLAAWGLQHLIYGPDPRAWWSARSVPLVLIVLLAGVHLAQLPMHTIIWISRHWSASVVSVATGSQQPLPNLHPCMRIEDADLFARAGQISPAAVVIPIYRTTHCPALWWVVHHPIQTLSFYMLHHVPGRARQPALQDRILTQQKHMFHAWASAAKGVLDVPDVIAMAKSLGDRGPVFVMAPRTLSVEPNSALRLVGTSDAFGLWQVSVARD
jgi:hypothetical protein